jgi:hypothetical protein
MSIVATYIPTQAPGISLGATAGATTTTTTSPRLVPVARPVSVCELGLGPTPVIGLRRPADPILGPEGSADQPGKV